MNEKVLRSLKELGTAFVPFPELPEVDLSDLAGLEAQAEKIREAASRIGPWVTTTMKRLESASSMSREARELAGEALLEAPKSLEAILGHEIPAYRRAAWLGFLAHEFSRELDSREEVERLLEKLVKEGRLVERADGELKGYDKTTYAVSQDAAFGKPEVAEVRKALSALLSRVYIETGRAWENKGQELRSRATIVCQEIVAGAPGICAFDVPPEKIQNGGQTFWRGGGLLLVQTDGTKIVPLDATGSIEAAVREARQLRVHLLVSSLGYETPPMVDLPLDAAKKVQLLWHLVKRAIRAETRNEQVLKARAELGDKATVTAPEWFLERKTGCCLVEFRGDWETPQGETIPGLFLLVERKGKKEPNVRIVEVPAHLAEFFAPCAGEIFPEQGTKFEGIGQPLRAVLQACYGQTSQSEAKTARIDGNK